MRPTPIPGSDSSDVAMALFVVLILILLSLAIWKVKKIYSFWDGKGIPHVGFWEYVRMTYGEFTKPLHDCVMENYAKHGRLYGSYQEIDPCLVVAEPEVIRQICLEDFSSFVDRFSAQQYGNKIWDNTLFSLTGTKWKNVRNIMSPGFTTSKLKEMLPKFVRVGNRTADFFVDLSAQNKSADVNDVFMKFTLDSIAAVVFSTDVDSNKDPQNTFRKYFFNIFGGDASWKAVVLFRMPRLFKLLRLDLLSKEHADVFLAFIREIVARRTRSNVKLNDQLQLFIDVLDDSEAKTGRTDTNDIDEKSAKRLTSGEIVSQALLFFLGGSDTIASTLTFATYILATHPDCQDKIVEEIDRVVGEDELTYEKLQELSYTEAVIKETIRLYTPDALNLRMCTKETTVQGIRFTPGMMVCLLLQALHKDPEFFPNPDDFVPERFLPENKGDVKPYTFVPFGVGPRGCIGVRQAMMQLKIALVCIYRKVKFERCGETVERIELKSRYLLRELAHPIMLRVVRREHESSGI